MKNTTLPVFLLLTSFVALHGVAVQKPASKPNILIILADDMGKELQSALQANVERGRSRL